MRKPSLATIFWTSARAMRGLLLRLLPLSTAICTGFIHYDRGASWWQTAIYALATLALMVVLEHGRTWIGHSSRRGPKPDGYRDVARWATHAQQRLRSRSLWVELVALTLLLILLLPSAVIAASLVAMVVALQTLRLFIFGRKSVCERTPDADARLCSLARSSICTLCLPVALALDIAMMHPWAWSLVLLQATLPLAELRRRLLGFGGTLLSPGFSRALRRLLSAPSDFQVLVAATTWTVNGVNVFSTNLVRGLMQSAVPARILLTEQATRLITIVEAELPRPADIPFAQLPVGYTQGWGPHWSAMLRVLEEAAPCVYIPNSDWRHSCICPQLSDRVVVVGVVHSDDPLHYDHVRRLGRYWNVIVAVSSAIASRTARLCPEIADRIITIPIGVRIPATRPARARSGSSLRLIYHGVLKQHQKRVLDLPRIVQSTLDLGVPVVLSIAGAGPDEAALREACASLVDRGAIRFLGLASPDAVATLLEQHDVYVLPSQFEGMPNALIEAMGHGCVPVVSRMESGIPELIGDGDNGFMVPVGDSVAFAERLRVLWESPERRERMSIRAHAAVRNGGFRIEDMVKAYRRAFADAWEEVRAGRYSRPRGALSPPPREIDGIGLLPLDLVHHEPGLGAFPSLKDAEEYVLHVAAMARDRESIGFRPDRRLTAGASARKLDGLPVFVATPAWTSNGVNRWAEDLVRGLRKVGLGARILLTEEATELVQIDAPRLHRPTDIPFESLAIAGEDNWGARWGAMVRTLESAAPCIYIPNYDWRHACIIPALSDRVKVVGTVHDSTPPYSEHAQRLGGYWDAAVVTSYPMSRHLRQQVPGIESRLAVIHHGLDFPAIWCERPLSGTGPKILVLALGDASLGGAELLRVAMDLSRGVADSRIVVVDPPPGCRSDLRAGGVELLVDGNRQEWLVQCRSSDFVLAGHWCDDLRSPWFEAMGNGCVPLWIGAVPTAGLLIEHGSSGILAADGNLDVLMAQIRELVSKPEGHRRLAAAAHAVACKASVRNEQMIDAFLALFGRLLDEPEAMNLRPRRSPILPPPASVDGQPIFPVELSEDHDLGRFPAADDVRRFIAEAGEWNPMI